MSHSSISRREFLWSASAIALSKGALSKHAMAQDTSLGTPQSQTLWNMAKHSKDVLTMTGWFTAQDVDNLLSSVAGLDNAINWCKQNGITKVHLEAFGRGLYADRKTLVNAKDRFLTEGFVVQSGVTTVDFAKRGFGDDMNAECYTVKVTQDELQRIFEYAAAVFDEIVIDDWYFTECQCAECVTARGDETWSKYYCDLMVQMSHERAMKAAHVVNPNVKVIIKFPQWYDEFHKRGYDVPRESIIFDGIWAGTESRNFDYDNGPGYEIGYNAYFNMRWLGSFRSVGGGWFDSSRSTVDTFLEQARHTVLGGGKEIILWCYSRMLEETHGTGATESSPVANMRALSKELPGLIKLAAIIHDKPIKGVHLLKPGNSDPFEEEWVCSFLGNLGLPFVPAHEIDEQAKSAVFPVQVLRDPGFSSSLQRMLDKGTPIIITDGLAKRLTSHPGILESKALTTLRVGKSPRELLKLTREELKPVRDKLLAPMGIAFDAPNKVELYLFGDNYFAVENINNDTVDVTLALPHVFTFRRALVLPEDAENEELSQSDNNVSMRIPPRTLVVVEYR